MVLNLYDHAFPIGTLTITELFPLRRNEFQITEGMVLKNLGEIVNEFFGEEMVAAFVIKFGNWGLEIYTGNSWLTIDIDNQHRFHRLNAFL